MTLSTTTNKASYAGDGVQTAFAVPFPFLENGHIVVELRDAAGGETSWVENTHYTLTGAADPAGGTLTVISSPTDYTPASGETLVIRRLVPETQETDYPTGGAFPASAHEQALDRLTMLIQQHSEELARSLTFSTSSPASGISIPDPEALLYLRWNESENALENADIVGQGSIGLPIAIAQGGTNATTAAAARTNLGAAAEAEVIKQGKHTIAVPAGAMTARTTNGAVLGKTELATNRVMQVTFDFDAASDEFVQFVVPMPTSWDEGTVTAEYLWTGEAGTGDVVWGIQGLSLGNDDAMDTAFGTAVTVTDSFLAADDLHISPTTAAVTIAGSPAAGDLVVFQVYRDANAAGDTKSEDAKLLGVRLFYAVDAGTDA